MSEQVLLVGASGELGSRIADSFIERGIPLRAMTRSADSLRHLVAAGAEIVEADMMDPNSLDAVMNVRQVVTTANSFTGRGRNAPAKIDLIGNRNLVDAARKAGVEHYLMVSAKVPDEFRRIDYFRIKAESEAYLGNSGLRHTILRPTAFLETWGQILGDSIRDKGVAPVFGPGLQKSNYIAIDDVAQVIALLVAEIPDNDRVVEIGGPDNVTAHELIDILAKVIQRTPKRRSVPLPLLWAISRIAGLFDPVTGRKMKTAYASATAPETFDFSSVKNRFPIAWTDIQTWARRNYGAEE